MSESDAEEPSSKKARLFTNNDLKRETTQEDTVDKIKRLRVSGENNQNEKLSQREGQMSQPMEMESEENREKTLAAQRRNYFLTVCEAVSYENFSNHSRRFLLTYPSHCALEECQHKNKKDECLEIANYAKETFRIDYKSQMWCEALHVCEMTLSPGSYLPAELMMDIVEIILNVHPDSYAGYSIPYILDRCLQTLLLMYRTHPPCSTVIRKCYKLFLTSPLTVKTETLSNRAEYECEKGIVKYCLNRLEAELKFDAVDGPLVKKSDHVTEEMKQSIRGLHWQKEKLEILETLDRNERIKRLMVALQGVVELLTLDLSIWLSRHIHNQGTHIMRSHRPLLSIILWSDKILYTGAVNNNCRQIISLFIDFIQLGCPENDIKVFTKLLNSIIQTFYMCENNSDGDYPHTGKYCTSFAKEMFSNMKDLSLQLKIKVLSRIEPTFMRYCIAMMCLNSTLQCEVNDIMSLLTSFIQNETWEEYEAAENYEFTTLKNKIQPAKKPLRIYAGFNRNLKTSMNKEIEDTNADIYPKRRRDRNESVECGKKEEIIELMLLALDAYMEMYGIDKVYDYLATPNEIINCENLKKTSYTLSEVFYKKYRGICKDINELKHIIKSSGAQNVFQSFKNNKSLELLGL